MPVCVCVCVCVCLCMYVSLCEISVPMFSVVPPALDCNTTLIFERKWFT